MTDIVNFSPGHVSYPLENAATMRYAAGSGYYIAEGTSIISDVHPNVADGPLNAFAEVSQSGLTLTLDTGEAVVAGAPIARDNTTEVTVEEHTLEQDIYLGWQHESPNAIRIGLETDFLEGEPRMKIFEVDSGSQISEVRDVRPIGRTQQFDNIEYETTLEFVRDAITNLTLDEDGNLTLENGDATFNGEVELTDRIFWDQVDRPIEVIMDDWAEISFHHPDGSARYSFGAETDGPFYIWNIDTQEYLLMANFNGDIDVPNGDLTVAGEIGQLEDHKNDTNNPHNVTNDQVNVTSEEVGGDWEITIDGDTYTFVTE